MNPNLNCKVYALGQFEKHLDLAVRGLPRTYLSLQQRLDYSLAKKVYANTLTALDRLDLEPNYFSSGIGGAAILSTALHPEMIEFWRALSYRNVYRDKRGYCAPGYLCQLIEAHQTNGEIRRSPDYQLCLFQSAMALAMAWIQHQSSETRYLALPPIPDVPRLIAEVCGKLEKRNSPDGFRSPGLIQPHWKIVPPPTVHHTIDPDTIRALAIQGAKVLKEDIAEATLNESVNWVLDRDHDMALAHPAALAGAAVCIARHQDSRRLWSEVFGDVGCWRPCKKRVPEANVAGLILGSINEANQPKNKEVARRLFKRMLAANELWIKDPTAWRTSLPRPKRNTAPLKPLWDGISVAFTPKIEFKSPYADARNGGSNKKRNASNGKRKKNPDAPGNRQKTGRAAEEWFMEHYHEVFPEFANGELLDHRLEFTGYDYLLVVSPELEIYIDVKGVLDDSLGPIIVDDCQWQRALSAGSNYYLVVVSGLESGKPVARTYGNPGGRARPVRQERQVTVISWTLDEEELKRLQEGSEEE
ncbi:MAG: DUF3883 domain-containing protein [Wenzhouxiangella sp.]|nr:MAG: DUF3883 domain-containing protein [Wenzhouxiangella sp.]